MRVPPLSGRALPLLGYSVFAKAFGLLTKTDGPDHLKCSAACRLVKLNSAVSATRVATASRYFSFSSGDRNWVRNAIGFVEARKLCVAALELVISRKVIVNRREILRGASRPHRETI